MKKIFTLLLALAGIVTTASASKTFYVKNNCGWNQIEVVQKNSSTSAETSSYLFINSVVNVTSFKVDNTNCYQVTLEDDTYTHFYIHRNWTGNDDRRTYELAMSDVNEGAYYYFDYDKTDGPEYYKLVSETVYKYDLTVTTTADWASCMIYAWKSDETSITGAFPGEAMTTKLTNVYGHTLYSTESSLGLTLSNVWGEGEGNRHQSGNLSVFPANYNFKLNDNSGTIEVSEYVTLNANGYCTYVNANPLNISGAKAYYAVDRGNGCATAYTMTNPIKNTPMLIKGENNRTYYFTVTSSGTDDPATNNFVAGNGTAPGSSDLTGYNYILNDDAFYLAAGYTVPRNKVYLHLSMPAASRALVFDDEETGVNTIVNEKAVDQNYYNLSGQRVVNPAKGLYIRDGKKVIIK